MGKFLEADMPFSSLIRPTEETIKNYQNIEEAVNFPWGTEDLRHASEGTFHSYHEALGCLEADDISNAQIQFNNFSDRVVADIKEEKTLNPEDMVHFVEHMMGLYYFTHKELTQTKAENEALKARIAELEAEKKKEPDAKYLGSENVPFALLAKALASGEPYKAMKQFVEGGDFIYRIITGDEDVDANQNYKYEKQLGKNKKLKKNHKTISKAMEVIDVCADWIDENPGSTVTMMQNSMIELDKKIKEDTITATELLPALESLAQRSFAQMYLKCNPSSPLPPQ